MDKRKNAWANLTPEEKDKKVKKMLASRKKNKKGKALTIRRPPPEQIETLEVPILGEPQSVSRLDRLAALIVAVEKLL